MLTRSFKSQVILLTLVGSLSAACSTLFSCRLQAGADVPLFGFDLNHDTLYRGKKENPIETVKLNDPRVEKMVALWERDWIFTLQFCNHR